MLLLALVVAAVLRFWQLDQVPPGLYRDEAFNGLDALRVLDGKHAIFFPANNGREPLYIYLTSLAIAIWGQTIFAARAAAATVGTLTTLPMFFLAQSWFGRRAGILAAWLWAITLWPVHLSRLGLRVVLIVPALVLTFWLATEAYRRQERWLWVVAGVAYGIGFYTYLAFRFTPLLLLLLVLYLILMGRGRRLWPGALWFLAGCLVVLLPLVFVVWRQPDLFLGRSGQVSILNPDVNGGSVLGALGSNLWAAAGMFIWKGDTILRHNPPGRPVFDPLLVIPFLIGLVWCVGNWRRSAATAVLLWLVVMLGPTILAADTPHFLRAAGALPAALLLPAIGLNRLWYWPRLNGNVAALLTAGLLLGSLFWTVNDYGRYAADPQVAFAFESAATDLAEQLRTEPDDVDVFLDERFWSAWPSVSFMVPDEGSIQRYQSATDLPQMFTIPATIYAWPYEPLDFIPERISLPALVSVVDGSLTRGDLEDSAYPLYTRFGVEAIAGERPAARASFGDKLHLVDVAAVAADPHALQVDIYWEADGPVTDDLVAFVHVIGPQGLSGQADLPPAQGRWRSTWWRQGLQIHDRLVIPLSVPYDAEQNQIEIGLYQANTGERLPVTAGAGSEDGATAWIVDVN